MWEVQTSEFAEMKDGRGIVGAGGGRSGSKPANKFHFLLNFNLCSPETTRFVEDDALIAGCIVALRWAIGTILAVGGRPQVLISIIQAITVNVVGHRSDRTRTNLRVKDEHLTVFTSHCDEPVSLLRRTPIVSRKFLVTPSAYFCRKALREWNKAVRWIERLLNSVTPHVALHKEPSFLVRLAAALLISRDYNTAEVY